MALKRNPTFSIDLTEFGGIKNDFAEAGKVTGDFGNIVLRNVCEDCVPGGVALLNSAHADGPSSADMNNPEPRLSRAAQKQVKRAQEINQGGGTVFIEGGFCDRAGVNCLGNAVCGATVYRMPDVSGSETSYTTSPPVMGSETSIKTS